MDERTYAAINHFGKMVMMLKQHGLSFDEALKLIQAFADIELKRQALRGPQPPEVPPTGGAS